MDMVNKQGRRKLPGLFIFNLVIVVLAIFLIAGLVRWYNEQEHFDDLDYLREVDVIVG